jgi:hypothetical protein
MAGLFSAIHVLSFAPRVESVSSTKATDVRYQQQGGRHAELPPLSADNLSFPRGCPGSAVTAGGSVR